MQIEFLYRQNLAVIIIMLSLLLAMSAVLGRWIRKLLKNKFPHREDALSNFVPTTILGLLALVLGFTFSMAVTRYEGRRDLVVREANAIGTSVLRADLLPAEFKDPIKSLLREYLKVRIDFHNIKLDTEKGRKVVAAADNLQQKIWALVTQATKNQKDPMTALNVSAMNEVFDIGSERTFATLNRIPELVYLIALLIASIGIGTLGFLEGAQSEKSFFNTSVLSVLFALVVGLILDIDRPQRGLIQISQAPLINILESLPETTPTSIKTPGSFALSPLRPLRPQDAPPARKRRRLN